MINALLKKTEKLENENKERETRIAKLLETDENGKYLIEETSRLSDELNSKTEDLREIYLTNEMVNYYSKQIELKKALLLKLTELRQRMDK